MTNFHKDASLGNRHPAHNWEYANAAARTGASGFVSTDVGKLARQLDDNSVWMLTATTPTWAAAIAAGATTGSTGLVQLANDLGGTATAPTVPEVRTARDSSYFGVYSTLDARLEAIESALVTLGVLPTVGIGALRLDFSLPTNSEYIPLVF